MTTLLCWNFDYSLICWLKLCKMKTIISVVGNNFCILWSCGEADIFMSKAGIKYWYWNRIPNLPHCCFSFVCRWHHYLLFILYRYSNSGFCTGSFWGSTVQFNRSKTVTESEKSKCMLFSHGKKIRPNFSKIWNVNAVPVKMVAYFQYLGSDQLLYLSFHLNIEHFEKKIRLKHSFFYRNKLFSPKARKYRIYATPLPLLDFAYFFSYIPFVSWWR